MLRIQSILPLSDTRLPPYRQMKNRRQTRDTFDRFHRLDIRTIADSGYLTERYRRQSLL